MADEHMPPPPITREERQEAMLRLAESCLPAEPVLTLTEWLADAESAFKAAKERLCCDLYDAWKIECWHLEREKGG